MNKLWVSIESIVASWSHSGSWAWKRDVALENPGSIKVCSWENHLELEDFPASHVWLPEGRHFGFQLISAHLLWGWKFLPYLVGSCGWPRRCFQGIETNEKKYCIERKRPFSKFNIKNYLWTICTWTIPCLLWDLDTRIPSRFIKIRSLNRRASKEGRASPWIIGWTAANHRWKELFGKRCDRQKGSWRPMMAHEEIKLRL